MQMAETATLALEVDDKTEEVQSLDQSVADLEALRHTEGLAEYERLKENRGFDRPQGGPWARLECVASGSPRTWWSWGWG